LNAFFVVFGIPPLVGVAISLTILSVEWRRQARIAAWMRGITEYRIQHYEFDSSAWTGR